MSIHALCIQHLLYTSHLGSLIWILGPGPQESSECSFHQLPSSAREGSGYKEGVVYQDVPPWITAIEWEMTADSGSSSSLSPCSGNDEMIATPAGPAPNTTTFPALHSFHTYLHCLLSTLGFSWDCQIYYQRCPFCITDVVCTTSCRLGLTPVLCTVHNNHQYHTFLLFGL